MFNTGSGRSEDCSLSITAWSVQDGAAVSVYQVKADTIALLQTPKDVQKRLYDAQKLKVLTVVAFSCASPLAEQLGPPRTLK